MGSLLENLKRYFEENTEEQIQKDWDDTAKYDEVNSPLVEDFVNNLKTMNITESSKLIAKYLGWKYIPFEPSLEVKAGWYKPSIGYSKGSVPHKDGKFWTYACRNNNQLRYYNSFDALIPAIEKLEAEELEDYFGHYEWVNKEKRSNFMNVSFSRFEGVSDFFINLDLDPPIRIGVGKGNGITKDTFKAVVEAIEYINNLKK